MVARNNRRSLKHNGNSCVSMEPMTNMFCFVLSFTANKQMLKTDIDNLYSK